jgi:hypothetical protein
MGRDIYGRNPGSTANGDAGSRPPNVWPSRMPPRTSTSQDEESGAEDDDRDRRQDAISCAANDGMPAAHVWARWLRSASPHSSGSAYVEVHRALATLCLLPACRIAGR